MEALPPAAFVRGYLRSYAKLLELDVDTLLGQLDRAGAADPDIAAVTVLSSQRASSDPLMRWMSVAVFFVLAVMVVIWWQTKNGVDPRGECPAEGSKSRSTTQAVPGNAGVAETGAEPGGDASAQHRRPTRRRVEQPQAAYGCARWS